MIKSLYCLSFLLFIVSSSFAQTDALKKYPEPLSIYKLQLGDQEVILNDGEAVQIEGKFENPEISLTAARNKTFEYGDVSFDYPIHFGYEVEEEDEGEYRIWTLDGNNFVITIYEFDFFTEIGVYIKEITGIFGDKNCKVDKSSMRLGDKTVKGKRIEVNMVGEKVTFNFMVVKSSESKTLFISFQDLLDDAGEQSDEGKLALKQIDETIVYNPRKL